MDGMVGEQLHAPDLMNAVAGYKVLVMGHDGLLVSPYHRSCHWVKPRQKADCRKHEAFSWTTWGPGYLQKVPAEQHEAPDVDCKCGLYSYHEADEFGQHYTPTCRGLSVICLTASEGRLAVHKKGIRAEWQEIRAIALDTGPKHFPKEGDEKLLEDCQNRVAEYADRWHVPLAMTWRSLPAIAAEMNLHPVPKSLLPHEDSPTKP